MSKFAKSINKYLTREVYHHGNISYFAKLDNNNWAAVKDGSLDWVEMTPIDFGNMLESLESIGADVRFTSLNPCSNGIWSLTYQSCS